MPGYPASFVPGEEEGCQGETAQGKYGQKQTLAADLGQGGPVVHHPPRGMQNLGQGEDLGKTFDPLRRPLQGEPDLGEKHHRPGDEVQGAAGELLADAAGKGGTLLNN